VAANQAFCRVIGVTVDAERDFPESGLRPGARRD
jgi:hypothetical protein